MGAASIRKNVDVLPDVKDAGQEQQGASFVLHVNQEMSSELVDSIHKMLSDLGVEGSLEPAPWVQQPRLQPALQRGEEMLVKWTRDGTLIEGRKLSSAWDITRQALDKARERGQLFSIRVAGQHYYPAEMLKFTRADLADITQALGSSDPGSKMIFLLRPHGALKGLKASEAIEQGMRDDVLRLAHSWATT